MKFEIKLLALNSVVAPVVQPFLTNQGESFNLQRNPTILDNFQRPKTGVRSQNLNADSLEDPPKYETFANQTPIIAVQGTLNVGSLPVLPASVVQTTA